MGKGSFARFLRLEKEINLELVGLRVEEHSSFGGRQSELAWTGMEKVICRLSLFPHLTEGLRPLTSRGHLKAPKKTKIQVLDDPALDLKGPLKEKMKEITLPSNSRDILRSLASFMFYLSEYDLRFIDIDNWVKATLLRWLEQLG